MLEEVHRAVPLVRVDQHADDLAQSTLGRQTAVIKQLVDAAEIIIFTCDRLSLVISPKSTICCSDVKTETSLRRGLLELGIHFGVTRGTCHLEVDTGGRSRPVVGVTRMRLCKGAKRSKRPKNPSSLHGTNIWRAASLELRAWLLRPPPCKVSDRALRMPCVPSLVGASRSFSIAIGLPHNADPAVQAGIECVKRWLVFWQNSDYYVRRACGGSASSSSAMGGPVH